MQIRVAIADKFLSAYAKLPRPQQQKMRNFIDLFKQNPTSSGINYETIHSASDPNLRSVRIGDDYRAIVLKPQIGNVYALLWVDHHDEAYSWAEKKRVVIHPETGSLQILSTTEEIREVVSSQEGKPKAKGLFSSFRDRELTRLGIPEALLPVVFSVNSEADLDKALPYFPEEAAEAMMALVAGYSPEEIYASQLAALESQENIGIPAAVDTEDFDAAMANPNTLRRFVIIEDDHELEELLDKPLEKWRVFLHPSQRRIVETNVNGSIRVLGGAGTGKTVVAMHRAKWLAQQLKNPNERILFTTFTKNLAVDIRANLRELCPGELMKRIEVTHLDAWVQQFLQKQGYEFRLTYQGPQAEAMAKQCWLNALELQPKDLNLPEGFYRDEWEQIVSPQGITEVKTYFKASRVGRGTALNRDMRKKVWPVFQEYRLQLKENSLRDVNDAYRDAREILEQKSNILPYRHVLLDETQDMGEQSLRLLRQIVAPGQNDLFMVGDAHQRIYRHKVVLKHCGISIQGRNHSFQLKINYRTTDEIRNWAVSLLENCEIDDLDAGKDSSKGYQSLMFGEKPVLKGFKEFGQETQFIVNSIQELTKDIPLQNICVTTRTNKQVTDYLQALERAGLSTHQIQTQQSDDSEQRGVRVATMHRVKGLEFDVVFVVGANANKLPLESALSGLGDDIEYENAETRERSLLYVAATRAKRLLFVSCFGEPSRFISGKIEKII